MSKRSLVFCWGGCFKEKSSWLFFLRKISLKLNLNFTWLTHLAHVRTFFSMRFSFYVLILEGLGHICILTNALGSPTTTFYGLVCEPLLFSRWWFKIFFIFTPTWGSNLTNIFQMGWNHQPDYFSRGLSSSKKEPPFCLMVVAFQDIIPWLPYWYWLYTYILSYLHSGKLT